MRIIKFAPNAGGEFSGAESRTRAAIAPFPRLIRNKLGRAPVRKKPMLITDYDLKNHLNKIRQLLNSHLTRV